MKQTLNWTRYLSLAAQAAAEGIVMLKNDGALPLPAGEPVALLGRIQLHYYKSGTGSGGMVNAAKVTGIPEGLTEAGVILDQPLLERYRAWDEAHPFDLGEGWGGEPWSQAEMPLTDAVAADAASRCKYAVAVIGRTAGEEQDNRDAEGSYRLTADELAMLRTARKAFAKLTVLLNTGNIMDMSWMDEVQPDAVLYVWQGGMTGGTGTAAVLTGAVSPSGKLPDTIAYALADYPSSPYFGGEKQNIYAEDIYVGYRYFETFAPEKVRYPFGFGLSYTAFSVSFGTPRAVRGLRYIPVTVTNTGACAGKETVQVYCAPPQGRLGQPARVLTAFYKTEELAAGASETVMLPLALPAAYDDSGVTGYPHAWVHESGVYRFYIGTDVRTAVFADAQTLAETELVQQCEQALAPVQPFQRLRPVSAGDGYAPAFEDVPLLRINEAKRRLDALPAALPVSDKTGTLADVRAGRLTLAEFVSQLSDKELMQIVRGEGMGSPRVTAGTASAFGGVTDALAAHGIPAACCSDGPSGMRLDCGTKAFSLPGGTMLAATFNVRLLKELFTCVGQEMTANRVDCLLGPGMNIHRHPLNGRNFEYFSEDPYLTGVIAAAELSGLHEAGVEGTVKHCCGNNQETGRHFMDSVISERALREIYLKGFETAVKAGGAQSIMTTYGAVNGVWTAGNYDLCTQIIRKEWGYTGFLMTDWWAHLNVRGAEPDLCSFSAMVRAQNDVYMVCADCTDESKDDLAASLADGSLTRGELQRCAVNICRFLLHTHAMERLTGEEQGVEVINRPADELDSGEPVVFYDLDTELTVSLADIDTSRGTSFAFALTVLKPGWYTAELTASAEGSALAQIPVTLFSMGTACGTFTWNGTDGKPVSQSGRLPMFSRYTTMRLYFAQSGLRMHSIRFTLLNAGVDMAALGEERGV